ncbi:NAD(P)/FAD-dependent oxidoreductase [Promicromonospora thailandica]|uniref:Sarcosine oxidase subunit beta n=1 Tax=Promicromonospora thailandica TaxID=765201 RepID=A0A9X2JUL3_9MICO|nr:FAD-binding oxidoreductase [Promicromonospora thailandica]MCP2264136.1 sarcosine oxidase subunit beta [Promicromonospora thailandica]
MTSAPRPVDRRGPLPARAEVVVVGGGAMGASVAFHLAEDGVDVLLLEAEELASGSSGKPIGGVRAQFSDPANVDLGNRSLELYEDFAQRPGADIGLQQPGYLFLLPDAADVALFEESVAMQNERGVASRMLGADEVRRLNPYVDVDRYAGAAYAARDGFAYPLAVVEGYAAGAERHGARVRTHVTATGFESRDDRLVAVWTDQGRVRTDAVVLCAGAWTRDVAAKAGLDLPVDPYRRQIGFTPALDPAPRRVPFTIDYGTTFYFHNADPDGLLLGIADPATPVAFERTYDPSWLPLLRGAAGACAPELADVPVARGWAGLYEMTPDRNALIGEATGVPGRVLYAAGFSGHGFLQAPAVGEVVRDLYAGRTPRIDVSGFDADRFAGTSTGTGRRGPESNII